MSHERFFPRIIFHNLNKGIPGATVEELSRIGLSGGAPKAIYACPTKTIYIQPDLGLKKTTKILVHELGHWLADITKCIYLDAYLDGWLYAFKGKFLSVATGKSPIWRRVLWKILEKYFGA